MQNKIRFSRFIAEADAIGLFGPKALLRLATKMRLTIKDICQILDRANAEWSKVVTHPIKNTKRTIRK